MNNSIPKVQSDIKVTPTITFTTDKGFNNSDKKVETINLKNLENTYEVVDKGEIYCTKIDINKISSSINDLNEQNYIDIRNNSDFYGNIEYIMWEDGNVILQKDGKIIGYTTYDAIGKAKPISVEKETIEPTITFETGEKNVVDSSKLNLSNVSSTNINEIAGNLEYKINDNGSVTLSKDGKVVGYTTEQELNHALGNNQNTNSTTTTTSNQENASNSQPNSTSSTETYAKTGTLDGSNLDYSKLSGTAFDANNGNFISEDKLYKESFNKDLNYEVRDDGSVLLTAGGTALGFTTTAALASALGNTSSNSSTNSDNNKNSNYNPLNNNINTNKKSNLSDNLNQDININLNQNNNLNTTTDTNNNQNTSTQESTTLNEPKANNNNYSNTETVNVNNQVVGTGEIKADNINMDNVSLSLNDLKNNTFMDVVDKKNITGLFGLYGSVDYTIWNDGTVLLQKNGKTLGYSTTDLLGIAKPVTVAIKK